MDENMTEHERRGPLASTRVVEFGSMASAAACGALLAAWGASVIKVEPPRGDVGRDAGAAAKTLPNGDRVNPRFELHNRGKQSIAIDLKHHQGIDLLHRVIDGAEVFVTNALPRVLKRFALEYGDLSARNDRLVYGQISGYGLGTADEDRPSFDHGAFWAQSGLAAYFGASAGGRPPQPSGGMGDRVAGAVLASGIGAALVGRERTGRGSHVTTSLLRTGAWMQGSVLSDALFTGRPSAPDRERTGMPTLNWFRTADDRLLYLQMMDPEAGWLRLVRVLDDPRLGAGDFGGGRRSDLAARSAEVVVTLDRIFASRPLGEWAERLDAESIRWEAVIDHVEFIAGDRARAAGAFVASRHPNLPLAVADPCTVGADPDEVPRAPAAGADTAAVFAQCGLSSEEIDGLIAEGVLVVAEEAPHG